MARLAQTEGLTEVQQEILATVKTFVDREIIPVAQELERTDTYPLQIVEGMKEMGLFGLTIPEEYGGLGESLLTYALVVEQIARGWMSVSGVINTHFIVAYMINQHGTDEQRQHYLPGMAEGRIRGAFSMSEPELGSDVAAIKTRARRDGDYYVVDGAKMWLTNGATSTLVATLVRTEEGAAKAHHNLTTLLVDKPTGYGEVAPGLSVPSKIDKMGYKGVDTTELVFDGYRIGADKVLGAAPGKGFAQMMDGVEVGRVNVAARACGLAIRACRRLRPAAQDLRQTDCSASGNRVQAGRDGHQGRGCAPDDGQRRPVQGLRRAQRRSDRHGEAAGQRVLQGDHRRRLPHPRRVRVLQGVRDRAADARSAVPAHRRGHERDPENDHQQGIAAGVRCTGLSAR
jgi:alkylation response protein AidB-like acyl-CoA dehydrogenase